MHCLHSCAALVRDLTHEFIHLAQHLNHKRSAEVKLDAVASSFPFHSAFIVVQMERKDMYNKLYSDYKQRFKTRKGSKQPIFPFS